MTPTEMRQLLAARDIRLTKSLGQNFLHDANQLRRIVAAANLTKADRVLEIGPGLGPLTALLLEQAGEVLAIEKDARLVEVLRSRFNVGQASRLSSSAEQDARRGQARRLPYICSTTMRWITSPAKRAIGASGSWWRTSRTPSPRLSWWNWPGEGERPREPNLCWNWFARTLVPRPMAGQSRSVARSAW